MPPIFLLVSAFLINMTLSRLVALEREQIGLLKALGYGPSADRGPLHQDRAGDHVVGIVIGFVAGAWLGKGLTRLYGDFFHFPFLIFRHDADIYAIAGAGLGRCRRRRRAAGRARGAGAGAGRRHAAAGAAALPQALRGHGSRRCCRSRS